MAKRPFVGPFEQWYDLEESVKKTKIYINKRKFENIIPYIYVKNAS